MRKKGKSSKNKKKTKSLIAVFIISLCLVLIIGFLIFYFINKMQPYYKIEKRSKNISESIKKDTADYKTVSWIRVQGTDIDYPVLYAPDYEFPLSMDPFAWTEADYKKLNNIVYISGHNILNLSKNPLIAEKGHVRFEQLMSFTYLEFVKANKYIQYTINGEDYLYKIFAVSYPISTSLDLYNDKEYSKEQMNEFINDALEQSIFKFDVDVNENDKILSLVTCTRMFGNVRSFKVDARLVRKNETLKNYDVEKTDNFLKIDKIMEGGSSNEEV